MKKVLFLLLTINIALAQELKQNVKVNAVPIGLSIDTTDNEGLLVVGGVNEYWSTYNCIPGSSNVWLNKYDVNKNLLWSKCLRNNPDEPYSGKPTAIKQLPDGSIMVARLQMTQKGTLTKLSSDGVVLWTKLYSSTDIFSYSSITSIIPYPDGSCLLAGCEVGWGFCIFKIDSEGNLLWKTYGGGNGSIVSIKPTLDGGYIAIGDDYHSWNVNVVRCSNPKGDSGDDVFVYKVDGNGVMQWQNCYGGSGYDNPHDMVQTSDGGYIFISSTLSADYDIQYPKGGKDLWIVKLSNTGVILWSRCYGGSSDEVPGRIFSKSNGNFLVCSTTASIDGDLLNRGTRSYENKNDMWLFEIDNSGSIKWQYVLNNKGEESVGFQEFYYGGSYLNKSGDFVFDKKRNLLSFATYQSLIETSYLWVGTIKIPDCHYNVSIGGTINENKSVDSADYINVSGNILPPNRIELKASKHISLNTGLSILGGTTFTAEIKNNCGSN